MGAGAGIGVELRRGSEGREGAGAGAGAGESEVEGKSIDKFENWKLNGNFFGKQGITLIVLHFL